MKKFLLFPSMSSQRSSRKQDSWPLVGVKHNITNKIRCAWTETRAFLQLSCETGEKIPKDVPIYCVSVTHS